MKRGDELPGPVTTADCRGGRLEDKLSTKTKAAVATSLPETGTGHLSPATALSLLRIRDHCRRGDRKIDVESQMGGDYKGTSRGVA